MSMSFHFHGIDFVFCYMGLTGSELFSHILLGVCTENLVPMNTKDKFHKLLAAPLGLFHPS